MDSQQTEGIPGIFQGMKEGVGLFGKELHALKGKVLARGLSESPTNGSMTLVASPKPWRWS